MSGALLLPLSSSKTAGRFFLYLLLRLKKISDSHRSTDQYNSFAVGMNWKQLRRTYAHASRNIASTSIANTSQVCVYQVGRDKASEYANPSGRLYPIPLCNRISRLRLCIAGFPLVDVMLPAAAGAN